MPQLLSLRTVLRDALDVMSIRIETLLAQMVVSDLDRAEAWYTAVFEGPPGTRPMDGLIEWRLFPHAGVQVFEDADRAGRSTMVVEIGDLEAVAKRLAGVGIEHGDPEPVTVGRVLQLTDPDGNRLVFTGP